MPDEERGREVPKRWERHNGLALVIAAPAALLACGVTVAAQIEQMSAPNVWLTAFASMMLIPLSFTTMSLRQKVVASVCGLLIATAPIWVYGVGFVEMLWVCVGGVVIVGAVLCALLVRSASEPSPPAQAHE